jgi:ATP-dependent Lhr-like helicase
MMIEGDLLTGELDIPLGWLEALESGGQALYIEPGLWIAAEHAGEYSAALIDRNREIGLHILMTVLRYRGAQTPQQVSDRYCGLKKRAAELLRELCHKEEDCGA